MTTFVAAGPLVNYFFYNAPTIQGGPNVPLEEGKIYFYADEDHSIELNSYSDVFDPNNPVVNPYPLVLGAAGECPIIYLEDRVYYIEIYDKNGVFQRSISHYAPGSASGSGENDALNYIPNGQFLLHNDLPATEDFEAGEIRAPITEIAYGGWTFERPSGSTSTDFVTFEPYDDYITNPTGNPRFFCHIRCTSPDSGDAFKQLCVKFPNVNRFASTMQAYTVAFSGLDNADTSTTIELYVIKNFGTGGSPQTEALIQTFSITPTTNTFSVSFNFGANTGKIIGDLGDDFLKLVFRFRVNEEFDISVVDFMQESGNITTPFYPETTDTQCISQALGGSFPVPNPDGSDIGLYPVLTKSGWKYDDSSVASVLWTLLSETPSGYLPLDGLTSYPYNGYSTDGIPYKRVADKLWISASNVYVGGSGDQFVTMQKVSGAPQNLTLAINSPEPFTAAANGPTSPGFTFTSVHTGNSTYGMTGYFSEEWLQIRMNSQGTFGLPTAGTSGFALESYRNLNRINGIVIINTIPVPAGLAGKYYTIDTPPTGFYNWFQVDGVGSDPAPGGTGILTNLQSTYSAVEVQQHIAASLSGQQLTNILCVAASSIPTGAWWTFTCSLGDFYVYYIKDGSGSDPLIGGKIGIRVDIAGTDTNVQVASKTLISVNRAYIGMPDARGKFPRIWDNGAGWDNPTQFRFNSFGLLSGDVVGSYEIDTYLSHAHEFSYDHTNFTGTLAASGPDEGLYSTPVTTISDTKFSGDEETRPVNLNFNVFIKI